MGKYQVAYGYTRELRGTTFEQAIERVTAALKDEGFGVLTSIDVKETLKKMLGSRLQALCHHRRLQSASCPASFRNRAGHQLRGSDAPTAGAGPDHPWRRWRARGRQGNPVSLRTRAMERSARVREIRRRSFVTSAPESNRRPRGSVGCVDWSGKRESNPRPSAWEADALPTELFPLGSPKASRAPGGRQGLPTASVYACVALASLFRGLETSTA